MAGRNNGPKQQCEVRNKQGLQCKATLSGGWNRCAHHLWLGAELFATELANGADVPDQLARHELLGLGLAVHEALVDGRLDRAALTLNDERNGSDD